ncbi:hypothetical protein FRB99_003278, partial [Tulasnella sp. 403]
MHLGDALPLDIRAPAVTTLSLPSFIGDILVSGTPVPPPVTNLKLPCVGLRRFPAVPDPAALRSMYLLVNKKVDYFKKLDLPHLYHLRIAFEDLPK